MSKNQRNPPCTEYVNQVCLITYLSFEEVVAVLQTKLDQGQIEYASCIYHDKDNTPAHTHIYMRMARSRDKAQLIRWFRGVDENGLLVNTFAESLVGTMQDIQRYFIHADNPDKYQYAESDIVYVGSACYIDSAKDDTYHIVEMLINGVSLLEIVKVYGKDFVYHYNHYRNLVADIKEIQNVTNGKNRTCNQQTDL